MYNLKKKKKKIEIFIFIFRENFILPEMELNIYDL